MLTSWADTALESHLSRSPRFSVVLMLPLLYSHDQDALDEWDEMEAGELETGEALGVSTFAEVVGSVTCNGHRSDAGPLHT
jgi:hypothetical protein